MPHVNGGGGDDLASTDEVKVYKDEGEEEKRTENFIEEKSSLVTETEEGKSSHIPGQSYSASKNTNATRAEEGSGKHSEPNPHERPGLSVGYVVTPYPHPNGSLGPVTMGKQVSMVQPPHPGSPLPFMMYNSEHFAQPPPAHMGIPPVHIDPKTGEYAAVTLGIPRPPMYPIPTPGQFPHPIYSPDFSQMQCLSAFHPRHSSAVYSITTSSFRGPYPTTMTVNTASLPRFSPTGMFPPPLGLTHPGIPHPAIVTPGPKQEMPPHTQENHRHLSVHDQHKSSSSNGSQEEESQNGEQKKRPHIKKPLNAFMLYMKEMRAKVVAECTLKESAAINQILGRRWHALDRSEQAKYYELARKERQLHMQLYPGWSARDNYAQQGKKKKRKRDKTQDGETSNPKKCRARFGLDHQSHWCKPCRRKKKCIRYRDGADGGDGSGTNNTDGDESTEEHSRLGDSSSLQEQPVPSAEQDIKPSINNLSTQESPKSSDELNSIVNQSNLSESGSPPHPGPSNSPSHSTSPKKTTAPTPPVVTVT